MAKESSGRPRRITKNSQARKVLEAMSKATALKTAPAKSVGLSKPIQPLAKVNHSFTVSLSCGLSYSEKRIQGAFFLVSNFVN